MRVRIRDLILWQWRPTLVKRGYSCCRYKWEDEKIVRELMVSIREDGLLEPIRINHDEEYIGWLSKKGMKQYDSGKWFVENGFHRIYAVRRLGYKTIEADIY